ncbi:MAG: hypothetical protein EBV03_02245 [Proteobacteria bacterium]|nr:hypothetical protein [Pseudomonadota bacterium]
MIQPASRQVIRVVVGHNQGRPAWWCLSMSKTTWERYRKDILQPQVDLSQFGEILDSGWGEWPPEEVVQALEREHGITLKKP